MELGAFQTMLDPHLRELLSAPRWVADGQQGPHWWSLERGCPCCGSAYGNGARHIPCEPVACLLCGSVQCMSNGLGNGRCSVCSYGLLPGWSRTDLQGNSHSTCEYARCDEPAVAFVPGKRYACMAHAMRRVGTDIQKSLAERDSGKGWAHWTFTGPRVPW